ncbi:MAG: SRPBCC domain-containing protein [Haliea sp.]|jgi:ligand-binding SRPBCC domain-containing protein|nr:SRPBCC domain-containing protein [Haliea sp.]MDP4788866.1 SRPBCC domain-containing protein [Haliea sp.]MDP4918784.1 SRPBCC domain-containing protein [Haliea sp.]MDP5064239.1 SRPBCC domain-containing protein [Haliea sp.]
MFQIQLSEEINAPKDVVWDVITNTQYYSLWNPFVVACESTFEVGAPIHMQVRVMPSKVRPQTETIFQNIEGELLEYGINAPLGALSSIRQHKLTSTDSGSTKYESVFRLKGWFSPVVGLFLGAQLNRGFNDMTAGIVSRSLEVYANKKS